MPFLKVGGEAVLEKQPGLCLTPPPAHFFAVELNSASD